MDGVLTCDVSTSPALAVGQPRDEFSQCVALPEDQHCCLQCGQLRRPMSDTEDSEQLEIEVRTHRRVIRRRRNKDAS
jgi:hypothetical protein